MSGRPAVSPPSVEPEPIAASAEPVFQPEILLPPKRELVSAPEIGAIVGTNGAESTVEPRSHEPMPDEADEPTAQDLEEFCQISVWRGYAKARFYARFDVDSGEEEFAVAESRPFRLHGGRIPEGRGTVAQAHTELIEALMEEGWEPVDHGGPWYASRFRRIVSPDREGQPEVVQT